MGIKFFFQIGNEYLFISTSTIVAKVLHGQRYSKPPCQCMRSEMMRWAAVPQRLLTNDSTWNKHRVLETWIDIQGVWFEVWEKWFGLEGTNVWLNERVLKAEKPDLGSERPVLRSKRPDFASLIPDFAIQNTCLRFEWPDFESTWHNFGFRSHNLRSKTQNLKSVRPNLVREKPNLGCEGKA